MKLVIQIPCLNEAEQLPATLADLPRALPGFTAVEWLVIDDGSTDGTAEVARAHGVDRVVSFPRNQGLATAFMTGLETALSMGADVIVNFDADNQYRAENIPALVEPVRLGRASMAVGARPVRDIEHFSPLKRALQTLGSRIVRGLSGAMVDDAPSGFRAFDREAATKLYVFSRYTYTLETLIQAGRLNLAVASVPIKVNPPTRPSRLMRSMASYLWRSGAILLRIFVLYYPLKAFSILAAIIAAPGLIAFLRFLIFYLQGEGGGHVQSLVIGAALLAVAAVLFVGGMIGDLIAANRVLLAEIRSRMLEEKIARIRGDAATGRGAGAGAGAGMAEALETGRRSAP
ncbi:MAG: glycosyltransferase family 2 protein [Paracoccaceae bacterium]